MGLGMSSTKSAIAIDDSDDAGPPQSPSKADVMVIGDSDDASPPSKSSKAGPIAIDDSDDDAPKKNLKPSGKGPKIQQKVQKKVQKKVSKTKRNTTKATLPSFASQVDNIHKRLGTTSARVNTGFHFKPISKVDIEIQSKVYNVYPQYGRRHVTPVNAKGDNLKKRIMQGSSWSNNSCAIDTFLWVLTVLDIRRTRNDVIALPKALEDVDEISRAVNEYLCLPLSRLTQQQLDSLRDVIYTLVSKDVNEQMNFKPSAGMDIDNLFSFALSPDVPLHQVSFSQVRASTCSNCPAYGIGRYADIRLLGTNEAPKLTPSEILQAWFGYRNIGNKKSTVKCVSCGQATHERRVVLDRLPNILLWSQGCSRSGNAVKDFSNLVEFDVQVAEEATLESAPGQEEVTVWRPTEIRATYKPVVLVIRDTNYAGGVAHYYAGSCSETEDSWLVYDGMKNPVVRPVKGFINQTASNAGREVKVVALQKVSEEFV